MSKRSIGELFVVPEAVADLRSCVKRVFAHYQGIVLEEVERRGVPSSAADLLETERAIHGCVAKIADQIVAMLMVLAMGTAKVRARAAEIVAAAESARGVRLRAHGIRGVVVRFLGGSLIRLMTSFCAPTYAGRPGRRREARGTNGVGCYARLDALGVVAGATPALGSDVARHAAALASFEEAGTDLRGRGLPLDNKTVRLLSQVWGDRFLRCRDERASNVTASLLQEGGGEFAGLRVAAVFDGGRTRTRVSGKRGRRRRKTRRRGYHTPWREPKVMALYEFDKKGRKTKRRPVYEGTFESWDDAFRVFRAECVRRGVGEAAELVIAGDGSPNVWDRVEAFVRGLGIDPRRVTKIVDFYHASQRVHAVAALRRSWTARQRDAWTRKTIKALRAGRIADVIAACERLAVGRNAGEIDKATEYFRKRKLLMRYAAFRKRGLPIGTGVVESAIRRIVNLRLKGPGIFWDVENAERMLALRAALKSGRWEELERDVFTVAAAQHRTLQARPRTRAAA